MYFKSETIEGEGKQFFLFRTDDFSLARHVIEQHIFEFKIRSLSVCISEDAFGDYKYFAFYTCGTWFKFDGNKTSIEPFEW